MRRLIPEVRSPLQLIVAANRFRSFETRTRCSPGRVKFAFETLRSIEQRFSPGKLQLTIFTPTRLVHGCQHRKTISWRLHLLTPDSLPELDSIRSLHLGHEYCPDPVYQDESMLKLDLRVIIDLAVKLPNLEHLKCKLHVSNAWTIDLESDAIRHYTLDWPAPHRDSRLDFSEALEAASLPSTLHLAQLDFLCPIEEATRIDHTQGLHDLVSPAIHAPFSASLRILSTQLQRLEIKVVADSTLFWPSDGVTSWPSLQTICILFHMASPSGEWYFRGPGRPDHSTSLEPKAHALVDEYPPLHNTAEDVHWDDNVDDRGFDSSSTTSRQFRVVPDDEILVPFLKAFGRAASHMLALKEACLWTPLNWNASDVDNYQDYNSTQISRYPDADLAWGITYLAPGRPKFHYSFGQSSSNSKQLWWGVGHWRPDEELRQLFQHIGDPDTELIEYWVREEFGQGLALRSRFEDFKIFGWRYPEKRWPLSVRDHQH